jgi:hypothetical protein
MAIKQVNIAWLPMLEELGPVIESHWVFGPTIVHVSAPAGLTALTAPVIVAVTVIT